MSRTDRTDAMWLAEQWESLNRAGPTLTHPKSIRQEHREQAGTSESLVPPEPRAAVTANLPVRIPPR